MALFAYVFAFGQTRGSHLQKMISNAASYFEDEKDFALRQLLHGAFREYIAINNSTPEDKEQLQMSPFLLIIGDNFEQIYVEFQNYTKARNFTDVYAYLYSIAKVACFDNWNQTRFMRHLIRYGRICQV